MAASMITDIEDLKKLFGSAPLPKHHNAATVEEAMTPDPEGLATSVTLSLNNPHSMDAETAAVMCQSVHDLLVSMGSKVMGDPNNKITPPAKTSMLRRIRLMECVGLGIVTVGTFEATVVLGDAVLNRVSSDMPNEAVAQAVGSFIFEAVMAAKDERCYVAEIMSFCLHQISPLEYKTHGTCAAVVSWVPVAVIEKQLAMPLKYDAKGSFTQFHPELLEVMVKRGNEAGLPIPDELLKKMGDA